jgi:hypothetical protein
VEREFRISTRHRTKIGGLKQRLNGDLGARLRRSFIEDLPVLFELGSLSRSFTHKKESVISHEARIVYTDVSLWRAWTTSTADFTLGRVDYGGTQHSC